MTAPTANRDTKSQTSTSTEPSDKTSVNHVDVLIVGAGISGLGGAYHLQTQCPNKSFAILDSKSEFGGTWRTHTYPGIRSDSDLFTFGYRFKPWTGAPIATAEEILSYLGEMIEENHLDDKINYDHQVESASWSSEAKRWTLSGYHTKTNRRFVYTANFLWMCQGYYRHSQGYTPTWEGMEDFAGQIVHPQTWPDDLDYAGKKVIVIGSGATAATLIPAMAPDCEHVTMLQRSPTFFATGRNANELADMLREIDIDEAWIHEIVRRRVLFDQAAFSKMCVEYPDEVRKELLQGVRDYLGEDYPIETHFNPRYRPWHQRVAFVPDGDLFEGIKSGKASVVTEEIERFTKNGILLKSGETLQADLIVTATGFDLNVLGDISFSIDSEPLEFHETITYRGAMFTGIPNMVWVFGYFRAAWTLRADMLGDFVCRLLKHMDNRGASVVTPTLQDDAQGMNLLPWVDPDNFNPGYLQRGLHLLPQQGDREPWIHGQDYSVEKDAFPAADLDDGNLVYA